MDTSKAAAAMGRAGRGASKVRGDRAHYQAIRAKRPAPQTYEDKGEWSGYTVREGLKGWIVEGWSYMTGERSGWRYVVAYSATWPRTTVLAEAVSDYPGAATHAECLMREARSAITAGAQAWETPIAGVRCLSRGHVVR